MKKMILTMAIVAGSLMSFAAGPEEVNPSVLKAFSKEFVSAKNVEWVATANYYRAAFTFNDKYVFAYYNPDGDLIGITRYISPDDLPVALQMNLKKQYEGYWISDLFEMSKADDTSYFITVENAGMKIMLKSVGGRWEVFKSDKKA